MHVLTLSDALPAPSNVYHCIFVAEQIKAVSELCEITAVAPVPVPLSQTRAAALRKLAADIPYAGFLNRARCYRPRYLEIPRWSSRLNIYSMLISVIWLIMRRRIRPDLIHAHFAYRSGYIGFLLARVLHKPLLLTVLGSDINVRTRRDFPVPIWRERTLVALRGADRIIAASKALKKRVLELGIEADRVTVVYNGISTMRFLPRDRATSRRLLGMPAEAPVVLFVGNLVSIKAVDVLLKAVAQIEPADTPVHLVIVGDGDLRNSLVDLAHELRLSSVEFRGREPNDRIPLYMSAANVLVLPSLNEGFGMVAVESLACGTPVVASRVGGLPEIVDSDRLGVLVEPADPPALAAAIRLVLSQHWDCETLVAQAAKFQSTSTARNMMRLYREVSTQ